MPSWINNSPVYHTYPIPEFQGNPLIEALQPPPPNVDTAILRLSDKPAFDESERKLPPEMRKFLPARLTRFLFPTTDHVRILKDVYYQVLDGYRSRNPLTADGQWLLHNAGTPGSQLNPPIESATVRPSTISFITGLSGMGKSTLIRGVMRVLGKPVILHSNFRGTPFTDTQIVYLMRNVPDQMGPKALAKTYGDYTDALLGKHFYGKLFADKSLTRTHYVSGLRRIVANHHVGALVLDDCQNLSLAGMAGAMELITLLVNLRDELGVPIILVGTYRAADILGSDVSIARRLVEGGFHDLKRPESPGDPDWKALCTIVWKYQWVSKPAELTDDIISTLYEYSQGITGIMLTLVVAAQIEAIDSGAERVDEVLLRDVYLERFKPLHKIINALRSKDLGLLNRYDDIFIKAFSELKDDGLLARIASLQAQLAAAQENQLGILSVKSENKGTPQPKAQKPPKLSTEDLAAMVYGGSTALPKALD
jgi:AAA domain-containing protein